MKRICKRTLALLMALTLMFSYVPKNIYAASYMSTEEDDSAVETTVNAEVYFVHAATKKIITMSGNVDEQVECTSLYDSNNVPTNAIMTVYYGTGTWGDSEGREVVNFVNKENNKSWRVTDSVKQINAYKNPKGWESVIMEAQGDGTIAFISCSNGKYVTIIDDKLGTIEIQDGESVSSNEKFIMYTATAPKTAKKITLSDVEGDSITVSWEGVGETLYSGYEVLYSTEEDGEYISAGYTADTTMKVTGLKLNTVYYFKVRTLTNNNGGVYSDSKVAYAKTLTDYKPSQPSGVEVSQKTEGMYISWEISRGAKKYEIYRGVSRFSTYEKIGETTEISYFDETPNDKKYQNYYKIKAVNDADESVLSEPGSLEISMFGTNTYIFADTDDQESIDSLEEEIFAKQHYSQFGENRYALMYKSGDYTSTEQAVQTGYYTQLLGLGKTPYDVRLANVKTPAALSGNNVTCNFWQGIENVTIADLDDNDDSYFAFQWAVSQAAPARRLNVERKAIFDWYNGWASGGYFADTYFHKSAGSYSQQQYYYRNCQIDGGIYGINWNNMLQGCKGITSENSSDNSGKSFANMVNLLSGEGKTNWDQRGCTTIISETSVIREKPFLYFDEESHEYKVFIPALRKESQGISWSENNMGKGTSISVDKCFYIANPEKDTAQTINKELQNGKNVIFAPGIYHVSEPIKVTKANTVLLGIGMATIIPDNKESAIIIDDVGGVSVAGLILDAGDYSETFIQVGEEGSNKDHSDNPTVLQDVIYRVGGTDALGRCDMCQVINSNDVIIDHTWIWRADHGDNVGWYDNTAKNGLIVNGDNVTAYGLFCEHFQEYDVLWRGENGKTYFLQTEKCYDPQSQEDWMSHNGTKKGYAAYKVANNVSTHYAVGLGIYDVFINTNGASIYLDNAIEVPNTENVLIENACTVEIANGSGPQVGINHIINDTTAGIRTGEGNNGGYAIQRLLSYSNKKSVSLPDYYELKESVETVEEVGETPTNDSQAEKNIKKDELSKDNEIPLWEMTDDDYCSRITYVDEKQPSKDTQQEEPKFTTNQATKLKSGQKFIVGKYKYKIIKVSGKTGKVAVTGVIAKCRKKLKKANIKATVKYKGYTFKITTVGKKAFKKCKNLKKVTLGKNVLTIKAKAFASSKKLKRMVIKGNRLKKVAKNAFNKKVRKALKIKGKKKSKKVIIKALKK